MPGKATATEESQALAKSLSPEVQGLPLELVGLAGFMVDTRVTLSDTLRDLKNHADLGSNSTTFQYGRPAHRAFEVSLKSLSPAAMFVVQVLSMLSPDAIPENFFCEGLGEARIAQSKVYESKTHAGYYLFEARLEKPGLAILATAEDICVRNGSANVGSAPTANGRGQVEAANPTWIKLRATALQISWAIRATSEVLELRRAYAATRLDGEDKYIGQVLLANAHNDLACQLLENGQYDAAEANLCISLEMKETLQCERSMPSYQFAEHYKNMALARTGQGKVEEAVTLSEKAISYLSAEEKGDPVYSIFQFIRGVCLANAGKLSDALTVFEQSYRCRVQASAFGDSGTHTLHNLYAIAFVQYRLGNYVNARQNVEKCLITVDDATGGLDDKDGKDGKDWATKRATSLDKLGGILSEHAPSSLDGRSLSELSDFELLLLFDLVVPVEAGRFNVRHQAAAASEP
ncbi:hypothetical protein V8F06_009991 [Rhypophila decipiens]